MIQTFWLDDYLCSKVKFHCCVALIDCKHFTEKLQSTEVGEIKDVPLSATTADMPQYPENELLVRQLIFADRILVNKIDLIPEAERPATVSFVRESVAKVNQNASVVETAFSKVDLDCFIR